MITAYFISKKTSIKIGVNIIGANDYFLNQLPLFPGSSNLNILGVLINLIALNGDDGYIQYIYNTDTLVEVSICNLQFKEIVIRKLGKYARYFSQEVNPILTLVFNNNL